MTSRIVRFAGLLVALTCLMLTPAVTLAEHDGKVQVLLLGTAPRSAAFVAL